MNKGLTGEATRLIGTTITVPAVDELTLLREENAKLKARLEILEWEKKYETICKTLDISFRLLRSNTRDFIIERIKENNFFQALKEFYKSEEIDEMLNNGITFEDIVRAVKEFESGLKDD